MAAFNEVAVGGSIGACRATFNFIFRISGSTTDPASVGGTSKRTSIWYLKPLGGTVCAKSAFYSVIRTPIIFGGSVAGSSAIHAVQKTVIARGGGTVSGLAIRTDPVNHYPNLPDYNPLITVAGASGLRVGRILSGTGGLSIAGESLSKVDFAYQTTGQLTLAGSAGTRHNLVIDLNVPWRVRGRITLEKQLIWDTGRLNEYFYRVTGKQRENVCPPIGAECCSFFVVNVHARTIEDLCQKLKEQNFIWPVERVERFSRPAESLVIAEDLANGITYDCNELIEVEICSIPLCEEFCIDADAVVSMGLTCQALFVNAEFTTETNLDLDEGESSLTISGTALASFTTNLYGQNYESGNGIAEDAVITFGGSAIVVVSAYSYVAEGGLSLSGTPDIVSSNWEFIGGDWPYETSLNYPLTVETYGSSLGSSYSAPNSWFSINDALEDDSNYATVNVSWLASSNFLILRNFKLNVPEEDSLVGLIQIDIKKYAADLVKDAEIYLVKGTEVLSPNLDQDWTWNTSESTSSYYAIADEYTASIPGTPKQIGGWNVEDVNDPEFGIAIRVLGDSNTSGVRAYINSVRMRAYYENLNSQTIKLGGSSDVKSSAWHYTASGALEIAGEVQVNSRAFTPSVAGGAKLGGNYELNFYYDGIGGISIDGEAIVQPIKALGGAMLGGEAVIAASNTVYEASGGLTMSYGVGTPDSFAQFILETSGGFSIGGTSNFIPQYAYEAAGGFEISGTSDLVSSVWHHSSEGAITLGGVADFQASNFEMFTEFNFDMDIFEIEYIFGEDEDSENLLVKSGDVINACGCLEIPVALRLSHNLVNRNRLSQFLARNSLYLGPEIKLNYNKINEMWQGNANFKGLSADLDTYETWNLLFEIKCTSFVGGTEIDKDVLVFSCSIKQKNLSTLDDYETRVIIGFLPSSSCQSGTFNIKLNYETQIDVAEVEPNAIIYYYRIYDDLDLFKNAYWSDNPNLKVQVSGTNLTTNQYRQNMDVIFSEEQARRPTGPLLVGPQVP